MEPRATAVRLRPPTAQWLRNNQSNLSSHVLGRPNEVLQRGVVLQHERNAPSPNFTTSA